MKCVNLPSILSFILFFLFLSTNSIAQYLETFSIQDRGVLPGTCSGTAASCITDYTGVDWIINGDFSGMDDGTPFGSPDFFCTTATSAGRLHAGGDCDASAPGICFETPVLDISSVVGPVSFSVELDWVSWDFFDIADVEYQLDGGSWVQLPPLPGTDGPGTVDYTSDGNTNSGVAAAAGLSGNTLSIRVCMVSDNASDDFFIDNISVPEASVIVLPVELISFKAKKTEDIVELNWSTVSETENLKFEIEHSSTGIEFEKIGEIQGNGTTLVASNYSFKHESPTVGQNYYRLKQVDFDGQHDYSDILSLRIETKKEHVGSFYPNPSETGSVSLEYIAIENSDAQISVYDISGKYISRQYVGVVKGKNNLNFDFKDLIEGIYLVKIKNKSASFFRKLVIN